MDIPGLNKKRIPQGYLNVIGAANVIGETLPPEEWHNNHCIEDAPYMGRLFKTEKEPVVYKYKKPSKTKAEIVSEEEYYKIKKATSLLKRAFKKVVRKAADALYEGKIIVKILSSNGDETLANSGLLLTLGESIFLTGYSTAIGQKGRVIFSKQSLQKYLSNSSAKPQIGLNTKNTPLLAQHLDYLILQHPGLGREKWILKLVQYTAFSSLFAINCKIPPTS